LTGRATRAGRRKTTAFLDAEGMKVIRFRNEEVTRDIEVGEVECDSRTIRRSQSAQQER